MSGVPVYEKVMEITLSRDSLEQLNLITGKARASEVRRWIAADLKKLKQNYLGRPWHAQPAKFMLRVEWHDWRLLEEKAREIHTYPARLVGQIIERRLVGQIIERRLVGKPRQKKLQL